MVTFVETIKKTANQIDFWTDPAIEEDKTGYYVLLGHSHQALTMWKEV
jgi:hypothetical protein